VSVDVDGRHENGSVELLGTGSIDVDALDGEYSNPAARTMGHPFYAF